ncbi:MAG: acetyl-CoA carboxylase biotin carboxylase subunit family protein [Sandaracinaceae bacterium]
MAGDSSALSVPTPRIQTPRSGPIALLGYSVETMEACDALGREFVAVVPEGFGDSLRSDGVDVIEWDFGLINETSDRLHTKLRERGVVTSLPLFEETVEWAGALNSRFRDDPRVFNRAMLLRDKAMMKRKAQMSGIRVGVFEELDDKAAAKRFFTRIRDALAGDDTEDPVHLKPTKAAGSVGHHAVKRVEQIDELPDDMFPCMAESHLAGQEFSVEAFIHNGQIQFMNINEYVHLGYCQFSPAGRALAEARPRIEAAVRKLVRAFGIQYGIIHPEYFLDADDELNFGEVAHRVPGGSIFELIQRAYGFDPYAAMVLCSDPETTPDELAYLPDPVEGRRGYAGNVLVYPQKAHIEELRIPDELIEHPYFEKHSMFEPVTSKVADRVGFGNHYGTIYFFGDDDAQMRQTLEHFEKVDFYV